MRLRDRLSNLNLEIILIQNQTLLITPTNVDGAKVKDGLTRIVERVARLVCATSLSHLNFPRIIIGVGVILTIDIHCHASSMPKVYVKDILDQKMCEVFARRFFEAVLLEELMGIFSSPRAKVSHFF